MQVLVTEATSPVAYHLLPLLANGDVLQQQKLHLILCDREENRDALEGVKYELQDCVFENVASIRVSCNFCEEFRIADLAIILPSSNPDHHGYSQVEVSHSFLPERDFRCLEGAVHKKSVRRKDSLFIQARGPMSKAYGISNYIKEAYQDSIKTVKLPKLEDPTIPTLSSIQIYGAAGCDLYDELILPKVYPTTLNKVQQMYLPTSDTMSSGMSTERTTDEQLFERLSRNNNQTDQVLLIYALEHLVDSHDCHEENIEREQTDLWSRL